MKPARRFVREQKVPWRNGCGLCVCALGSEIVCVCVSKGVSLHYLSGLHSEHPPGVNKQVYACVCKNVPKVGK